MLGLVKTMWRFLLLLLFICIYNPVSGQSIYRRISKPLPCQRDIVRELEYSFFLYRTETSQLAINPDGAVILFLHFDDTGNLLEAEYLIAGEARDDLRKMGEDFVQRIQGFTCSEAVDYPRTLVIPVAFVPYPYFEYYRDPDLRWEKTIYQLRPWLGRLLYDLNQSESFYVWETYRYPMRYLKAKE